MADTFERYYEYLEPQTETNKEKMIKDFINFLENPDVYGGFFVIRWKGNDEIYNREALKDFVNNVR